MKWGKLLWMRYIRANGILERFLCCCCYDSLSRSLALSLLISCCWLFILSHSVLSLCRLFYVLADLLSLVWRGWYYRLSLSAHSKVLFHVHRKSNLRVDFVIFMFTFTLFRYLKNKKKIFVITFFFHLFINSNSYRKKYSKKKINWTYALSPLHVLYYIEMYKKKYIHISTRTDSPDDFM